MQLLDSRGHRHDFLNDFSADKRSDDPRSGARKENAVSFRGKAVLALEAAQKVQHLFPLLGVVAFVGLGQYLTARGRENIFAGCAPHIDATEHSRAFADRCFRRRGRLHCERIHCKRLNLEQDIVRHKQSSSLSVLYRPSPGLCLTQPAVTGKMQHVIRGGSRAP